MFMERILGTLNLILHLAPKLGAGAVGLSIQCFAFNTAQSFSATHHMIFYLNESCLNNFSARDIHYRTSNHDLHPGQGHSGIQSGTPTYFLSRKHLLPSIGWLCQMVKIHQKSCDVILVFFLVMFYINDITRVSWL